MNLHNVRMVLGPKILKIESTNFGLFWTKNRALSQCVLPEKFINVDKDSIKYCVNVMFTKSLQK